jgi:hypothetical protein
MPAPIGLAAPLPAAFTLEPLWSKGFWLLLNGLLDGVLMLLNELPTGFILDWKPGCWPWA